MPDRGWGYAQVANKGSVNGVVPGLETKYLQSNIIEGLIVYRV